MDLVRTRTVVADIIVTVVHDGRSLCLFSLDRSLGFCYFGPLHYGCVRLVEGGHLFRRIEQERGIIRVISIHLGTWPLKPVDTKGFTFIAVGGTAMPFSTQDSQKSWGSRPSNPFSPLSVVGETGGVMIRLTKSER